MRRHPRVVLVAVTAASAAALACAAHDPAALERGRARFEALRQYQVPPDYEAKVLARLGSAAEAPGSVLLSEPNGAIACGHVKAQGPRGEPAGFLPFGALFERGGALRTLRVFERFQGMYATSVGNLVATDDDLAIAIACNVPLVFR